MKDKIYSLPRKLLFINVVLLISLTSFAQQGNNWVFGKNLHLDFNNEIPKLDTLNLYDTSIIGNSASISNCDGSLMLFYKGRSIFDINLDALLNELPNKSDFLQNTFFINNEDKTVSFFDSREKYLNESSSMRKYVFSYNSSGELVFRDSSLLFDVSNQLNNIYAFSITQHPDSGYWFAGALGDSLFAIHLYNNKILYVSKTRVFGNQNVSFGKFSPSGNYFGGFDLAASSSQNRFLLFSFDKTTGKFSNMKSFLRYTQGHHIVNNYHYTPNMFEFSPNDSFVYIMGSFGGPGTIVSQFGIYHSTPNSTYNLIYVKNDNNKIGDLQITPNNNILLIRKKSHNATLVGFYIDEIRKPNKYGKDCQYVEDPYNFGALPYIYTFPRGYFPIRKLGFHFSGTDGNFTCTDKVDIFNSSDSTYFKDFLWFWGDGDSTQGFVGSHQYKKSGKYKVTLRGTNSCGANQWYSDTIHIEFPAKGNIDIQNLSYLCDSLILKVAPKDTQNVSFMRLWVDTTEYQDPNKTLVFHKENYIGIDSLPIRMIFSNNKCTDTVSTWIPFHFNDTPKANLSISNSILCQGENLEIYNRSIGYDSLIVFTKDTFLSYHFDTIKFNNLDTGIHQFLLKVYTKGGCTDSAFASCYVSPFPQITLDSSTIVSCGITKFTIKPLAQFADSVWSKHTDNDTITYGQSMLYENTFYVKNKYCIDSVSVSKTIPYKPAISISFDSINPVCIDKSILIKPNILGNSRQIWWKINGVEVSFDEELSFQFQDSGTYNIIAITINSAGCLDSFSRKVKVEDNVINPRFSLIPIDTFDCIVNEFLVVKEQSYNNDTIYFFETENFLIDSVVHFTKDSIVIYSFYLDYEEVPFGYKEIIRIVEQVSCSDSFEIFPPFAYRNPRYLFDSNLALQVLDNNTIKAIVPKQVKGKFISRNNGATTNFETATERIFRVNTTESSHNFTLYQSVDGIIPCMSYFGYNSIHLSANSIDSCLELKWNSLNLSPYNVKKQDYRLVITEQYGKDKRTDTFKILGNQNSYCHTIQPLKDYCYTVLNFNTFSDSFPHISNTVCIESDGLPAYWIPNAFTPNYDLKNEVFKIINNTNQVLSFEVYNRWGAWLYNSQQELQPTWDGKFQGVQVQDGIYRLIITNQLTGEKQNKMLTIYR